MPITFSSLTSLFHSVVFRSPFVEKQVVVAWCFEVLQVFARLIRRVNAFEGAASGELIFGFDEDPQIIGCENIENIPSDLLEREESWKQTRAFPTHFIVIALSEILMFQFLVIGQGLRKKATIEDQTLR